MTYRVEYFDFGTRKIEVCMVEGADSNEAKSVFNSKYAKRGKFSSMCEANTYKEMLKKYGDIMRH